jgi:hypothetical protein
MPMPRPAARLLLSTLLLMSFGVAAAAGAATPKSARRGPAQAAKGGATPGVTYRISAETTTMRSIKMPSLGQMMGGGSLSFSTETSRSLLLRLQSPRTPASGPQAEHRIPAGLQLGTALPLLSPQGGAGPERPGEIPPIEPGAKARLLRFWGCGAQAGPGQPKVMELGTDRTRLAEAFKTLRANPALRSGPSGTIGTWPSGNDGPKIPLGASLVGEHVVIGNYSPEIRFSLDGSKDFLGALDLKTAPEGEALRLSWGTVPQALAYGGQVIGLGKGGGTDNRDIVIWESSAQRDGLSQAEAELTPSVIAKLVAQGVLLGPERNSCVMSAEARRAMELPTTSLQAYGGVSLFQGPGWVVMLERESQATLPPFDGLGPQDGGGKPEGGGGKGGGGFNPFKLF